MIIEFPSLTLHGVEPHSSFLKASISLNAGFRFYRKYTNQRYRLGFEIITTTLNFSKWKARSGRYAN